MPTPTLSLLFMGGHTLEQEPHRISIAKYYQLPRLIATVLVILAYVFFMINTATPSADLFCVHHVSSNEEDDDAIRAMEDTDCLLKVRMGSPVVLGLFWTAETFEYNFELENCEVVSGNDLETQKSKAGSIQYGLTDGSYLLQLKAKDGGVYNAVAMRNRQAVSRKCLDIQLFQASTVNVHKKQLEYHLDHHPTSFSVPLAMILAVAAVFTLRALVWDQFEVNAREGTVKIQTKSGYGTTLDFSVYPVDRVMKFGVKEYNELELAMQDSRGRVSNSRALGSFGASAGRTLFRAAYLAQIQATANQSQGGGTVMANYHNIFCKVRTDSVMGSPNTDPSRVALVSIFSQPHLTFDEADEIASMLNRFLRECIDEAVHVTTGEDFSPRPASTVGVEGLYGSGSEVEAVQGMELNDLSTPRLNQSPQDNFAPLIQQRQTTCVVCLTNIPKIVFFPCKHAIVCINCSEGLETCPMCRTPISQKTVMYLP
eukprot:Clim_evm78s215 gene=Clim_evmTU78s215